MPGTRGTRWTSRLPQAVAAMPWLLASIGVIVLLLLLVKALVAVLGHDRYTEHGAGSRSEAVMVPGVPVTTGPVTATPSPSPTRTRRATTGGGTGVVPSATGRTPVASRSASPSASVSPTTVALTPPPTTLLNDDAPGITYRGRWAVSRNRPFGDHRDDVHYTVHDGDSFSFTFTGTGLDYITSRDPEYGDADVWVVDSGGRPVKQQRVSARAHRYQPQQTVFSVQGLPAGRYTIWAVKRGGVYFQVDALRVRG
ncbi:hypothetical protein AB0I90_26410 [Micromonospora wenchangensis]|uniref:Uncharacterized protein n=1 Tax=Micromonospora wenchangensis TaxID=1185415 RepID=A0A246RJT6_9ACTN|nr:hypothetical protein [Micromonospora wenchangensis]OWV04016.1 hypothetical protein B5D80_21120 [Micromonospora wenchangensis]